MSIVSLDLSNISDPDIAQALQDLQNAINHITDDNIDVEAGINPSKIGFSVDMEEHAVRHMSGGADALPSNSISTAMLQPRCVTRDKIGLRAIGAQELDPSAITGLLAFDTAPITYNHGDTIPYIDGIPHDNQYAVLVGFNISSADSESGIINIEIYAKIGEAVKCHSFAEDNNGENTGTVQVIRVGFKNKYAD